MKFGRLLLLFLFAAVLTGCLDSATNEPEVIVEPSARSNFYIVNQTELDVNVIYEIAFLDRDSTVAVPADSTIKIFEAGDIGSSPLPSHAFEELRFFELSNNASPLLIIHPIVDENWDISGEDDATGFELVITSDDIK